MASKRRGIEAEAALEALYGPLTFGKHLRAIREGEGWTQGQLAKKLGVTLAHVSDVENERKVVSVERAARWAKRLGFPPVLFVRLTLEDQVRRAGLRYRVRLENPKAA